MKDYSIKDYKIIFWDFDGVIKESVEIKNQAYKKLFCHCDPNVLNKITQHHNSYNGISRFEKIPLYLEWAGYEVSDNLINQYCQALCKLVKQDVINSPWVPGVLSFLSERNQDQIYILVTATPQDEIEEILIRLNILEFFSKIYGAPNKKELAIKDAIIKYSAQNSKCLMIGDSQSDLIAASNNRIDFFLRKTPHNLKVQLAFSGPKFNDFHELYSV